MPKIKWDKVAESEEYKSADPSVRYEVRKQYYQTQVRPNVPEEDRQLASKVFFHYANKKDKETYEPTFAERNPKIAATLNMPKAIGKAVVDPVFSKDVLLEKAKRRSGRTFIDEVTAPVAAAYNLAYDLPPAVMGLAEGAINVARSVPAVASGLFDLEDVQKKFTEGMESGAAFFSPIGAGRAKSDAGEELLETIFAPAVEAKVALYNAADRFENSPNARGALRFVGDAAELAYMAAVFGKSTQAVKSGRGLTKAPLPEGAKAVQQLPFEKTKLGMQFKKINESGVKIKELNEREAFLLERVPDSRARVSELATIDAKRAALIESINLPELTIGPPDKVILTAEQKRQYSQLYSQVRRMEREAKAEKWRLTDRESRAKTQSALNQAAHIDRVETKGAADASISRFAERGERVPQEPPTILPEQQPGRPARMFNEVLPEQVPPDANYLLDRATEKLGGKVAPPEVPGEFGQKITDRTPHVDIRTSMLNDINNRIAQGEALLVETGGRSPQVLEGIKELKKQRDRVAGEKFDPTLEEIIGGKTGKTEPSLKPGETKTVRTIGNILKDVDAAIGGLPKVGDVLKGETGAVDLTGVKGSSKRFQQRYNSPEAIAARERLSKDYDRLQQEAAKAGKTVAQVADEIGLEGGIVGAMESAKFEAPPATKYDTISKMYDASWEASKDIKTKKVSEALKSAGRNFVDTSLNISMEMQQKKYGELGKEAVSFQERSRGASGEIKIQILESVDKVIGRSENSKALSNNEIRTLGEMLHSLNVLNIEKVKPGHKHAGGWTAEQHTAWLKEGILTDIQKRFKVSAEEAVKIRDRISERADRFHEVMSDQLRQAMEEGVISEAVYNELKSRQYAPRWVLEKLDPTDQSAARSGGLSVGESGIQKLKEGSYGLVEVNPDIFLRQVIARTQGRIFKNRAAKALHEFSKMENDIVRPAKVVSRTKAGAEIYETAPNGYTTVKAMVEGRPVEMHMRSNIAGEWAVTDPTLNRAHINTMQILSGTKLLKTMATGINPEFAFTNLARDLLLIYSSHENPYSSVLPAYAVQMGWNMAKVLPDVAMKKGRVREYIREGGSMETLTEQGLSWMRSDNLRQSPGLRDAVIDIAGYINNSSELLTRIAIREGHIKKSVKEYKNTFKEAKKKGEPPPKFDMKKIQENATWQARKYMDFAKSGSVTREAGAYMPYLEAAINASRTVARAAKEDPVKLSFKMAQVGGLAAAIYAAGWETNPEAMSSLPDDQVVRNFNFPFPPSFHTLNERGEKEYYGIRIPKDQGARPITSACEAIVDLHQGREFRGKRVGISVMEATPAIPFANIPPTSAAVLAYVGNYDNYTMSPVWRGSYNEIEPKEEYDERTSPMAVDVGQTLNLSPAKLERATGKMVTSRNVYTDAIGLSYNMLTDQMPEKEQVKTTHAFLEKLSKLPGFRKFVFKTRAYSEQDREKIKQAKIDVNTKAFVQKRDGEKVFDAFYRDKNPETRQAVMNFVKNSEDPENTAKRFINYGTMRHMKDRWWWAGAKSLPPKERALQVWSKISSTPTEERPQLIVDMMRVPEFASKDFIKYLSELSQPRRQ